MIEQVISDLLDVLKKKKGEITLPVYDKRNLNIVLKCYDKSKAPLKAILAAGIAKIVYPDWDIRKHQIQIGGLYSLRSIDTRHVACELYRIGLYDTPTSFALTRSFEKAECYDLKYSGNISPIIVKQPFLRLIGIMNSKRRNNKNIILHVLQWLMQNKQTLEDMKISKHVKTRQATLEYVDATIDRLLNMGPGSSVVPVVITHVVCSLVFRDISIKPLKYHTSADKYSCSIGDIEGFYKKHPKLAIEIKFNIAIDDTIVLSFDNKSKGVPMRIVLTTKYMCMQVRNDNILVGNVKEFCLHHLQGMQLRDSNIYTRFVAQLRTNLMNTSNLSNLLKSMINL